jgi:cleavage stimulation factor subunit 3
VGKCGRGYNSSFWRARPNSISAPKLFAAHLPRPMAATVVPPRIAAYPAAAYTAAAQSSSSSSSPSTTPLSLLDRLDASPWDVSSWRALLASLDSLPVETARAHYERCLRVFPTAGRVVVAWGRREVREGQAERAEALLQRHLLASTDAEMWIFYVELVVHTKYAPAKAAAAALAAPDRPPPAATGEESAAASAALAAARTAVLGAFDFALGRIGSAHHAGPLWGAYLKFLAEELPTDTPYLLSQAREVRRKAYRRSVAVAHARTDALWAEYGAFEREFSQSKLAESLIAQLQLDHGTASAVYRERVSLWARIDTAFLPAPAPLPSDVAAAAAAAAPDQAAALQAQRDKLAEQLAAWRRVLGYELSNPLQLPREAHFEMVRLHYRQCLALCARYCPEVWGDFAAFELQVAPALAAAPPQASATSAADGAAAAAAADLVSAVWSSAVQALPGCVTVALAAADHHELQKRNAQAAAVYTGVLETLHALAGKKDGRVEQRRSGGEGAGTTADPAAASAAGTATAAPAPPSSPHPTLALIDAAPTSPDGSLHTSPLLLLATADDAARAAEAIPVVYILYQRAARRMEGVQAARAVFASARKSPFGTPLLYLASAQLEYYTNRSLDAARNILEAGRKRFPADLDFLLSAADFLAAVDDSTNMKAFFEGALKGVGGGVAPSDSRPLWDRYLAYELSRVQGGGSLSAVGEVERARARVHPALDHPDVPALTRVMHRYAPYGLLPATRLDAEFLRRHSYSAFAAVPAPLPSGREGVADAAPQSDGPVATLAGREATGKLRDGHYLQAPVGLSTPLSHVPVRDAIRATAVPVEVFGPGGAATSVPATAALAAAAAALAASASASASGAGRKAGDGGADGGGAGGFVEVPPFLHFLLARLPAYDPLAGPLPEVDSIVQKLVAYGRPAAAAAAGGQHGVGGEPALKRARGE